MFFDRVGLEFGQSIHVAGGLSVFFLHFLFSANTMFSQRLPVLLYFCPEEYGMLCAGCFLILCHYYIFAKTPFLLYFCPEEYGMLCAGVFLFSATIIFSQKPLFYCTFVPKQKYQKFSAQKERWLGQTGINYQLSNFDAGSFLLRNLRCLHQNLHYGFKYILMQLPSADFSPSPRRLTSHIICATQITLALME